MEQKPKRLLGSKPLHRVLEEAYYKKIMHEGLTCQQIQQAIINCELCDKEIQIKSLKKTTSPNDVQQQRQNCQLNNKMQLTIDQQQQHQRTWKKPTPWSS
jgi:hypothetical protein